MQIQENASLAPYTFFKIGGRARYFCEVKNKEELIEAVSWAKAGNSPVFVLGGGSNIVVADEGWPGLVIKNSIAGITEDGPLVRVGAGEEWDKFAEFAVSRNLAGVECLSGIPGTVGASPVQNIGAYGQSVGEAVESLEAFDSETGRELVFGKSDCEFGYRTSMFKKNPGRYIVTSVNFSLVPSGEPTLKYHELKNYFLGKTPSLSEVREAVLKIRSKKGMVARGEELHSSVGSFFTNPVIQAAQLENLKFKITECKKVKNCCTDPWFWVRADLPADATHQALQAGGRVKISAACLIECAGFEKGMRVGNVGISPLHSLALMNYGGASAKEILFLADEIKAEVKEKFKVDLEIEPQLVGF